MSHSHKLIFKVLLFSVLCLSIAFGQARIIALGGNPYIEDPSRVFLNPAKLSKYSNMAYGESNSRVFGALSLGDAATLGLICPQALNHRMIYDSASVAAPGAFNLHLALAFGAMGIELSSEARNVLAITDYSSPAYTLDQTQKIRSYDVKFGMGLGALELTVAGGLVLEKDLSGSSGATPADHNVVTLSGSGYDFGVDVLFLSGSDTKFGGYFNGGAELFQEKLTQEQVVGGTAVANPDVTYPGNRLIDVSAGVLSEVGLTQSFKLYAMLGIGLDWMAFTQEMNAALGLDKVDRGTFVYTVPELRLGMEQKVRDVWKIEEVRLRAGVSKVTTKPSRINSEVTNVATSIKVTTNTRATGAPAKAVWTLGAGLKQGSFRLDATVTPGSLDGVYFLNGAGPNLASITLSYKFGGGSSSGSSYGGSSSYDSPAETTPAVDSSAPLFE